MRRNSYHLRKSQNEFQLNSNENEFESMTFPKLEKIKNNVQVTVRPELKHNATGNDQNVVETHFKGYVC